ncbi:nitroreductase/quinone reductase family protein [Streptomyces sp. MNU76]|uniref:nitroreductase/quinone reductase family protein n=1 Tax=Streptomyces sp. MNU76 TaxID=2560026 RepID=UPI001E60B14A|nr:nitroreductase/quinone reductase family protein [Streptomyces sp. MNU76]MCC9710569.1 nitroreductase/quinone reductase family protein [Streptomyces sp. MNU76]
MPNPFNQQVIDEFRARHGEVGGYFEGARLILLTTTGARTGKRHTTPLGYLPDGDGTILVIASAGGSPKHPDWYRNITADPRVTVETGAFTYEAEAVVLGGEERDRAFARAVEDEPGWAEYQAKTDRTIPVVALREVPVAGPPNVNADSMGEALKVVHDAFRRELGLVKKELTATGGRAGLGAQLRINCLTFCQGLHNHHNGEAMGLFPFLGERHPELAPTLSRLHEEHERITVLVEELRRVVTAEDAAPADVLPEVERLIDELEAHLAYEEQQLIPVLEAAAKPEAWAAEHEGEDETVTS